MTFLTAASLHQSDVAPGLDDQAAALSARLIDDALVGRETDLGATSDRMWVLAIDHLIDHGQLETAHQTSRRLAELYPKHKYFTSVRIALDNLPPASGVDSIDRFCDDRSRDVQVVRRFGSRTTILAFCAGVRLTLPLNLIHRWFAQVDANIVYVRDVRAALFLKGIRSLAPDLEGTLTQLRGILEALETERLCCYGGSKGGYGCLLYGLLLKADAILALGAPTGAPDPKIKALPWDGDLRVDSLRPRFEVAPLPPRCHLVFGELMDRDRRQADNLAGLPTISLEPVPGVADHNVAKDLVRIGRLAPLIRGLTDADVREAIWSCRVKP